MLYLQCQKCYWKFYFTWFLSKYFWLVEGAWPYPLCLIFEINGSESSHIVVTVFETWFSISTTCVKWFCRVSKFLTLRAGVRQGEVLSPVLYFQSQLTALLRKLSWWMLVVIYQQFVVVYFYTLMTSCYLRQLQLQHYKSYLHLMKTNSSTLIRALKLNSHFVFHLAASSMFSVVSLNRLIAVF